MKDGRMSFWDKGCLFTVSSQDGRLKTPLIFIKAQPLQEFHTHTYDLITFQRPGVAADRL